MTVYLVIDIDTKEPLKCFVDKFLAEQYCRNRKAFVEEIKLETQTWM